jgi:hypothetical protein
MIWVLLGAAWLAFNVGFVAGCAWARRRAEERRESDAIWSRVSTTIRVQKTTGDTVFIPRDPVPFITGAVEN